MADQKVKTREEALAPIIAKAWQDKNFKQELIKDPKSAIKKIKGVEFPGNVKITVLEESADQLYIILPARPESGALSDDQLEAVAGGVSPFSPGLMFGPGVYIGAPIGTDGPMRREHW